MGLVIGRQIVIALQGIERLLKSRIRDRDRRRRKPLALLLGLSATLLSGAAAAGGETGTTNSGYIVTIGGFGDLEPRFEGARHFRFGYQPIFDVRSAGSREWLNLPRDGFDFAFIETANFRAGFVGNGRWERDVSSLTRGFRHVANVNLSLEAGAFAEWWPQNYLRTRLEVRDAVIGAEGVAGDLAVDGVYKPTDRWTLTAGPRLSLADQTFMRSYYSVNAEQSLKSGLPMYSANGGIRSIGAGSMAKFKVTDTLSTMAFVEYQRLGTEAFNSPLVDRRGSPDQLTVGVGLSLSFVVGK